MLADRNGRLRILVEAGDWDKGSITLLSLFCICFIFIMILIVNYHIMIHSFMQQIFLSDFYVLDAPLIIEQLI